MKSYLVNDFTGLEVSNDGRLRPEPKQAVVTEDKIWNVIDAAKENGHKIAVFEVGECVLDWS